MNIPQSHPKRDSKTPVVKSFGLSPVADQWLDRREAAMKPYILGAIIVWFVCGIAGSVLLGQQRVDVATIAGGPIALWNGLNSPAYG